MELEINGKTYEFKFGTKFIRQVDIHCPVEQEGLKFGFGLAAKVVPELQGGNTNTLSKTLVWANETEKEKVTLDMIDDYLDDCKDIEKLFDKVLDELSKSNSGKLVMKNFQKNLEKEPKK